MAAFSGCSYIQNESEEKDETRIETIEVINRHDEPHTITIQIEDGASLVLDRSFSLAAAPHVDGYPEVAVVETVDLSELAERSSDFTVGAMAESGEEVEHRLAAILNMDCVKIQFVVNREGSLRFLISSC